jgi:SOS-response transcriptional repressor LexA
MNNNLMELRIYRAAKRMFEETTGTKISMDEIRNEFKKLSKSARNSEIKVLKSQGYLKY